LQSIKSKVKFYYYMNKSKVIKLKNNNSTNRPNSKKFNVNL